MGNTKNRGIRVDDELWDAATDAARENRETVSDVVRRALIQYVKDNPPTDGVGFTDGRFQVTSDHRPIDGTMTFGGKS